MKQSLHNHRMIAGWTDVLEPGKPGTSAAKAHSPGADGRRRRALLRISSSAMFALPLPALATTLNAPAVVPSVPRLKVACFALFPFAMQDAQGPHGITVELTKLLARESGLQIAPLVVPYPRAVAMLTSGEVDLMFGFPNAQLLRSARSLGVVAVGDVVLLGRAGSHITQRADLKGKIVGHVRGAEYDAAIQSDSSVATYETVSYEQTVRMLLLGRIDAALGVRVSLLGTLRQLGIPRQSLGPMLILSKREMLLHYSAKHYLPQHAATLAHALATLRENGAIAALYRPYEEGLK